MGWDDVGKSAKHKGIPPHSAVRRTMPPVRKSPAAATGMKPARKRYGFAMEVGWRDGPWIQWFHTERQRDQAMAAEQKKIASYPYPTRREITGPVDRV